MGRLSSYLTLLASSRAFAPNLKAMTLQLFTGKGHKGNEIARGVVRDHLLLLRWMNPNAVIYLRETKGQGTPSVEYSLWSGESKTFEIKPELSPEEVVAKVMMAARDPALDDARLKDTEAGIPPRPIAAATVPAGVTSSTAVPVSPPVDATPAFGRAELRPPVAPTSVASEQRLA